MNASTIVTLGIETAAFLLVIFITGVLVAKFLDERVLVPIFLGIIAVVIVGNFAVNAVLYLA